MSTQVPEVIQSLTNLVDHLTTTPFHSGFPFPRFAVLHAFRVSVVWAGLTGGGKVVRTGNGGDRVGVLGDLFGYLVMCWGGSTLVSILQSQPPPWLLSPQIWIIYITIYLLTLPTGLSSLISRVPGINILGAWTDGLTRGFTVSAISSTPHTILGRALLSVIGTGGGGWIVGLLGMAGAGGEGWKLGVPGILRSGQGVLGTMDVWAAILGSVIYSSLTSTNSHSNSSTSSSSGSGFESGYLLSSSRSIMEKYIPDSTFKSLQTLQLPSHARSTVIVVMASLFFARIITTSLTASSSSPITQTRTKTSIKNGIKTKSNESKTRKVGEEIDSLVQEIEAKAQKAASKVGSKNESGNASGSGSGNGGTGDSANNTPRKRK